MTPTLASTPALTVRAADAADADAINRIHNHYIRNTAITFEIEPWSAQRRADWLRRFDAPYHALVAELDGAVAGFAYNTEFRNKAAYRRSTETTVYADAQTQSRGVGAALYQRLFELLAQHDFHRAFAAISLPNPGSVAFHLRFGFAQVGVLSEVGHKFGRYIDTAWFEKALD
ncbi:MAG: GNAT family N-acetyltransferase [bacterium]